MTDQEKHARLLLVDAAYRKGYSQGIDDTIQALEDAGILLHPRDIAKAVALKPERHGNPGFVP